MKRFGAGDDARLVAHDFERLRQLCDRSSDRIDVKTSLIYRQPIQSLNGLGFRLQCRYELGKWA